MKKFRTYSYVVLGSGLLLAFVYIIALAIKFVTISHNGGFGIIGRADLPETLRIILSDYWPSIVVGLVLAVCAAFCLVFSKTVMNNCTLKTTAVSIGISHAGLWGLYCFLQCVFFHEMSKHPIRFPASIVIGLLSFAAFVFLIVLYCRLRKQKLSIKGLLIDIATCVVTFALFLIIIPIVSNFVTFAYHDFYK